MIKAVIFDMDGVIADTEDAVAQATIDMFKQLYDVEAKKDDFLPFVGTGAKNYIRGVAEKYNRNAKIPDGDECATITPQSIGKISLSTSQTGKFFQCPTLRGASNKESPCFSMGRFNMEKALKIREENFAKIALAGGIKPFPGAVERIREAKRLGLKTAIATSSHKTILEITLKGMNINKNEFNAITTAEECKNVKPDPEIFLLTAKKLSVSPQDSLVIEDSPAGIKAAKKGGFIAVGVAQTFSKDKLQEADFVVDSLREMSIMNLMSSK